MTKALSEPFIYIQSLLSFVWSQRDILFFPRVVVLLNTCFPCYCHRLIISYVGIDSFKGEVSRESDVKPKNVFLSAETKIIIVIVYSFVTARHRVHTVGRDGLKLEKC